MYLMKEKDLRHVQCSQNILGVTQEVCNMVLIIFKFPDVFRSLQMDFKKTCRLCLQPTRM